MEAMMGVMMEAMMILALEEAFQEHERAHEACEQEAGEEEGEDHHHHHLRQAQEAQSEVRTVEAFLEGEEACWREGIRECLNFLDFERAPQGLLEEAQRPLMARARMEVLRARQDWLERVGEWWLRPWL